VTIVPHYLAPLYEGFVADPKALKQLQFDLEPLISMPSVTVEVWWDEKSKSGSMTLLVPEKMTIGEPLAAQLRADRPVDGAALEPLMGALGAWRASLGNRFDMRLLAFETRLAFWDELTGSRCYAIGAVGDPAGKRVGPCFRCLDPKGPVHNICRAGDEWPAHLEGPKRGRRMLGSALKSKR
jgi:hypothetical protein